MDSGPQEHLEVETIFGVFREVAMAGGGRPDCISKFLTHIVTSSVTIWVIDLGADGINGRNI